MQLIVQPQNIYIHFPLNLLKINCCTYEDWIAIKQKRCILILNGPRVRNLRFNIVFHKKILTVISKLKIHRLNHNLKDIFCDWYQNVMFTKFLLYRCFSYLHFSCDWLLLKLSFCFMPFLHFRRTISIAIWWRNEYK